MQWIKTHLMIVIVGSISLLSLTGLVLGFVLTDVNEKLEADSRVLSSLESSKKINEKVIEATRDLMKKDAVRIEEEFRKYQDAEAYTPLDDKLFADKLPATELESAFSRFQANMPSSLPDCSISFGPRTCPVTRSLPNTKGKSKPSATRTTRSWLWASAGPRLQLPSEVTGLARWPAEPGHQEPSAVWATRRPAVCG